ncbi:AraC family transcriptional regulator [Paenibacillus sp. CF384]|uniref:AraC family transcriptional regulator n=1 Tax=Paenibacillus sp. CF384 TaxID=1884382 RepID=UPI0008999D2B|nr:helix-turn-helix domain-containing protein [Paenibacillus sp. CF384]SDX89823.1 AraC-type DNA-binding protein [Paenibacillus sp. CF384]
MDKEYRTNRNETFLKNLFSYFLIIFISIIISTAAYLISVQIIRDEIDKAHYNSLNQVKRIVDDRLSEVSKLFLQIGLDQRIQLAMNYGASLKPGEIFNLAQIQKDLLKYKLTNPIIKEIYIYFSNNKIILYDDGKFPLDALDKAEFSSNSTLTRQWLEGKEVGFIPYKANNLQNEIVFMESLSIPRKKNMSGKLIVVFDKKVINPLIEGLKWMDENEILIVDKNNRAFLFGEQNDSSRLISEANFDNLTSTTNSKKYVTSHVTSNITQWKYISVIPRHIYFGRVNQVKSVIYVSLFLCLLFGGLVAYLFAYKNYKPMNKLIQFIRSDIKHSYAREENEYDFIKNVLEKVYKEKEVINVQISKQRDKLRNQFMTKMVKGKLHLDGIEEMLALYDIQISNDNFYVVMVFYEISNLNLDMANFIVQNIAEELVNEKFRGFYLQDDDYSICLVDVGKEDLHGSERDIKAIVQQIKKINQEKFGIFLSVAISQYEKGFSGISQAYKVAVEVMEYHILMGRSEVLSYSDLQRYNNKVHHHLLHDEHQFINYVLVMDYDNAKRIFNTIIQEWFINDMPSFQLAKCRMYSIINALIIALKELKRSYGEEFIQNNQLIDRLLQCESLSELKHVIDEMMDRIEVYFKRDDPYKSEEIHKKVMSYIKEHYSLQELNVSKIADEFQIDVPYLSKSFKKGTGIGPLKFLHMIRIDKAKELLVNTNTNIRDISTEVGYISTVSFTRVFKQYEGITPGAYRDIMK